MKIKGEKIQGLNEEVIVIPRGEGQIVFKARAIANYDVHDAMNPRPKPKKMRNRQQELIERTDEPGYVAALDEYATRKISFMVIESLKATEDLEWETVNHDDPSTWNNWTSELKDSGFTQPEIDRIFAGVLTACGLNEDKVEKARSRFLASQQAESERLSSLKDVPNNTPFGEPASDSE